MKTKDLEAYERTYCDCTQCVAPCKTMPGSLAPGDADRIIEHMGLEHDEATLTSAFRASEGALVIRNGVPLRIPTIVPAQRPDGSCVFLRDDRCTVHQVAPFGCSRFNVCDSHQNVRQYNRASAAMLKHILHSAPYILMWSWLHKNGAIAPPLTERRERFERLLEQ